MNRDEEESIYENIGNGCTMHGDAYMQDCRVCGHEFCMRCHPNSSVCPECMDEDSEETEADAEAEPEAAGDGEVDALLDEADGLGLKDDSDQDDRRRGRD